MSTPAIRFAPVALTRAAIALTLTSTCAYAQGINANRTSADNSTTLEEIVVTGSHVARAGYEAPTPTTVVTAEAMEDRGITNVADLLNSVPSFAASESPRAGTVGFGAFGQNFVNLRSLGTNRTLVLVDGTRLVPSSINGAVDLNLIPSIALDRTEVVTGGASAAYGSDAVAGVVNLMVKRDYEGLSVNLQGGMTQENDARERSLSLLGGTALADGRLHLVGAAEYYKNDGIGNLTNRSWAKRSVGTMTGPYPGSIYIVPDIQFNIFALGGVFFSPGGPTPFQPGPLTGTAFTASGSPYTLQTGNTFGNAGASIQSGGNNSLAYFTSVLPILAPTERYAGLLSAGLDLSDDTKLTGSFNYGHVESSHLSVPFIGAEPIFPGNAFIPSSVTVTQPYLLGKIGGIDYNQRGYGNTARFAVKIEGKIADDWKWDAHASYGQSKTVVDYENDVIPARMGQAVNAVRVTSTNVGSSGLTIGSIVCQSTLSNPNDGCVPINLFGQGNITTAALKYVTGTSHSATTIKTSSVAANLSGEPFSSWAGPVSLAAGYEFRRDQVKTVVDDLSQQGLFDVFNPKAVRGTIKVNEAYVETVLPLLSGMSYAKELDLNAAVRRTHYDTTGGVTSWKVGLTHEVNPLLRLRGTVSRDIRAPNVSELFTSNATSLSAIVFQGGQPLVPVLTGGNTNLKPETSTTKSLGFTLTPTANTHLTIDYFNIDLKGAIASVPAQTLVNQCLAGVSSACAYVTFGNNGATLISVNMSLQNLNKIKTSGYDFEVGQQVDLKSGNRIDWSLLGTYVTHMITTDVNGSIDFAGVVGRGIINQSNNTLPRLTMDANASYDLEKFGTALNIHYVGRSKLDPKATVPTQININSLPSRTYVNVNFHYNLALSGEKSAQLYVGINNLFNVDPPDNLPFGAIGGENAGSFYDTQGRRYYLGSRFKF